MTELKPYPEYKDSGVEWVGDVPESWETLSLKYLFRLVYRYPTYYGINYESTGIKEIRGEMLKGNGKIDIENVPIRYISKKTSDQYPLTQLKTGDIVMSVRGTMGKIGLVTTEVEGSNITANLLRLSPDTNKVESKYLALLMENTKFIDELENQSDKTTISTITVPRLLNIKISIPSLKEQQEIYKYVSEQIIQIDSLIADKERLIELLEEKRQAVITETVTKGLDPNVKMKDSGIEWIGEIPEHWEMTKIKYQSKINARTLSDKTNPEEKITYIDIGSVDSNGNVVEKEVLEFRNAPSRARRIVKEGDTIVSTVRTYLQAITMIDEKTSDCIVSTGFAVLTPKDTVVNDYFGLYFRSTPVLDRILSISKGINYPAINSSDLAQLDFIYPPYEEQKRIVKTINRKLQEIENVISEIKRQQIKLMEYRESLIYEAVTGKIDIRNYELEDTVV